MYGLTDEIRGLNDDIAALTKENVSLKSEIASLKKSQLQKDSIAEFYGKWLLMNPKCTNSQRKTVESFIAYIEQQR